MIDLLKKEYPAKVGHSVSHTTRAPRPGEENGKHYHFVTVEQFDDLVAEGKFIETAVVHKNKYGTTFAAVKAVTDEGKLCLMDLDVQGCQSVRRVGFDALLLFIAPPAMEDLIARLKARGTETDELIQIRLETAKNEMKFLKDPMWDHILINDSLETCYAQLKTLINTMEHGFLG